MFRLFTYLPTLLRFVLDDLNTFVSVIVTRLANEVDLVFVSGSYFLL